MNPIKSPIWKQAVEDFLSSEFNYGDTVPHNWFVQHFRLGEPKTAKEQKVFQAALATSFAKFKRKMLKSNLMDFVNIWGSGYLIVRPGDQTGVALKDTREAIRKSLCEGAQRLVFVNQDMLSDAQRQENTDAINKLTALQSMAAPKQWLR